MLWNDALADAISSRRMRAKEPGREKYQTPCRHGQTLFTVMTSVQEDESA